MVIGKNGRFGDMGVEVALEDSDDGQNFRSIGPIQEGAVEHTIAFPPVTARYFRVTFATRVAATGSADAQFSYSIPISELVLHPDARVNHFEDKAAFRPMSDLYGFATPYVTPADAIRKGDVIDLTGRLHPDGTLNWTPPPGNWVVLRIGYSLLGITNHPATKEATGLEVDKLNAAYVKKYMNAYLDSYKNTVGADYMGKRGIQYVVTDSWEAGAQNWTDDMIAEFTKRRGYDPQFLCILGDGERCSSSFNNRQGQHH